MNSNDKTSSLAHPSLGGAGGGTRGLRLNNPGNIRKGRSRWQGMSADQPDKAFVKFDSLVMGYRAMWILLNNYWHTYGCHTLRKVIQRWAPPNENDTNRYLKTLSITLLPTVGKASPNVPLPTDVCPNGEGTELAAPNQDYSLWEKIIVGMVKQEGNYTPDCKDYIREAYRRAFGKNPLPIMGNRG